MGVRADRCLTLGQKRPKSGQNMLNFCSISAWVCLTFVKIGLGDA